MKIVKAGKTLTSEALNAEMIINENIRKSNEDARNVWTDDYEPDRPYKKWNKTGFNGSSYMCKLDCQGIVPNSSTIYWQLISAAGAGLSDASQLPITDTGNYYINKNTGAALQEIGTKELETVGSGVLYNSGLLVSTQSTPNMTVSVTTGTAYMPNGTRMTPVANTSLAITTADVTNPRMDIVYVDSTGVISYLAGTASATPTAPSLPSGGILLGEVYVSANVTTITSSNITDKRTIIKSNTDLVVAINENTSQLADIVHQAPEPNGVDDTQALKDFFASGYKNVQLKGTYRVNLTEGDSIVSFLNTDNIKIFGQDAKILDLKTDYTNNGAITPIFKFNNCKNIDINLDYEGQALPNPNTDLGYTGATILQFVNGCDGIKIRGTHKNCRYGVLSGNYIVSNDGYCKGFDIDVVTDFVGYSCALYLAEIKQINILATNTHRACYLAGVNGGVGAEVNVKFKDQYIAPIQVLITDAMTGDGTSKGCSNLKIKARDLGSTIFPTTGSFCTGISLSRVDPNTIFENLEFNVYVNGTDTISSKVGGFFVASNAKDYNAIYPFNWESSIYLRNIKVKGLIDKSAQTIANGTNGDIYMSTTDTVGHSATISNFETDGLIILSCTIPSKNITFDLSNLIDNASFKNLIVKNVGVGISGNAISNVDFLNSDIPSLTITGKYSFTNSKVGSISDTGNNGNFTNSIINNAKLSIRLAKKEITMNGASPIVWTGAIPVGAMVLDVQTLITETITGSTNISVGTPTTTNLYAWGSPVTLGAKTTATAGTAAALTPTRYSVATNLQITGTGAFTGGKLLVMVWYIEMIAPSL